MSLVAFISTCFAAVKLRFLSPACITFKSFHFGHARMFIMFIKRTFMTNFTVIFTLFETTVTKAIKNTTIQYVMANVTASNAGDTASFSKTINTTIEWLFNMCCLH